MVGLVKLPQLLDYNVKTLEKSQAKTEKKAESEELENTSLLMFLMDFRCF